MKSNKTSPKSAKIADKPAAAPSEPLSKESKQIKRTTKSSTVANSPTPQSTPHRHSKQSVPASVVVKEVIKTTKVAAPTPAPDNAVVAGSKPTIEEVSLLAHSFWVERNYAHGFSEEDWLRAEKALSAAAR